MKVRCVNTDPEQFAIADEHKAYFKSRFGRSAVKLFDSVEVGQEYVVYAIAVYRQYPFFYVPYRGRTDDWMFVPSLCFEVLDPRVSKFWFVGLEPTKVVTLAIKEWVQEPSFFERLVDCKERELKIMLDAVAAMDAEFA